jgi:glycosyltransferase involved in cell wall biosynthesis
MANKTHPPLLSVVIPCYNEEKTILEIFQAVDRAAPRSKEIIIVNDHSTDGTRQVLETRLQSHPQVKIIHHPTNQGKGAALHTGIRAATGDIVIIQDADLEYNPEEYEKLIKPIVAGKADVVYGSRFLGGGEHRVVYYWHYVGNRFLTFLSNAFSNINLSDMETGYKVFKREIIQSLPLHEKRFGFEPEVTAKIARLRCVIYEVGISYYGRTYEEGKKIGWRDGVRAIYCLLKYNLFVRH